MSKKHYDEKQQIDCGKSYKYSFVSFIILNLIIYIAIEFIGLEISASTNLLINLGIPISVYMISMVLKNTYDGTKKFGEELNISALGGCGVALMIIYLSDVLSGKTMLIENLIISDNAGALLVSVLMLTVSVTYLFKKHFEKKKSYDN